MRVFTFCCLLLGLLVLAAVPGIAETRYVSDQISITLRRGPGTQYRILRSVTTGTALEVIEEEGDYLKVRTRDGLEGYVLKQYISAQLPRAQVIARLERELGQLRERQAEMTGQATEWGQEKKALQQQLAESQRALSREQESRAALERQYRVLQEGASNVVELMEERDRLQEENSRYGSDLERLRRENENLLRKAMIKWFLAGAGVLFGGWLLGKSSRTKKRPF